MKLAIRSTALTCAVLALATMTLAQDHPASPDTLRHSAWALQFGVGSNFTLTSFQGSLIGCQYHYSPGSALRLSLSFNGQFGDNTNVGTVNQSGSLSSLTSNDNASHNSTVSLVMQNVWYVNPGDVVHAYFAAGPELTYSHMYSQASGIQQAIPPATNWSTNSSENTNVTWGAGARGAVGVEWFAVRWLSLHAEYLFDVQYQWGSMSSSTSYVSGGPGYGSTSTGVQESSSKGWQMTSLGVLLGVSVYI